MEKAYIGGIQRFSTEDGPGIRTTVFLAGCPLKCKWCHNPELLDSEYNVLFKEKDCIGCGRCVAVCAAGALKLNIDKHKVTFDRVLCNKCGDCVDACCTGALYTKSNNYSDEELIEILAKDNDYYEMSGGGITLSGGEILSHPEYALHLAEIIKDEGYSLAIETSGFGDSSALLNLAKQSDIILFDMKVMDPDKHLEFIGADPDLIRKNLEMLSAEEDVRSKIVIRVPVIKGINDDTENMTSLLDHMTKLGLDRIDILPYHNMGIGKAKQAGLEQQEFETPDDEALEAARKIFTEAGITAKVMGHED